jgi:hypothetical protein
MEAVGSSKTLVHFYQTTRQYSSHMELVRDQYSDHLVKWEVNSSFSNKCPFSHVLIKKVILQFMNK